MNNEYKDDWERIQEYKVELGKSIFQVSKMLIYAIIFGYMPAIVINLFFPRLELSFFHSSLIAAGIGLVILVIEWWEHKKQKKNEKVENQ